MVGDAVDGIVLAAGRGGRLGLGPKAWLVLGGRTLLERAVATMRLVTDRVIVGVGAGDLDRARALLDGEVMVVPGGATLRETMLAAFRAGSAPLVLIHDVAHPFVTPALARWVIEVARRGGAAVAAVVSMSPAHRRAPGAEPARLGPGEAWLVRRPFAFRRADFTRGLERGPSEEGLGVILARAGVRAEFVPAPSWNIKVTRADDWAVARAIERRYGVRLCTLDDLTTRKPWTTREKIVKKAQPDPAMSTVGLVGLGLLGHAVAARLLGAGHTVVGFDVLAERAHALAGMGGRTAPSARAVAEAAEVTCTLLPSLAAVEEAVLGAAGALAGARPGAVIIQMSTISPALTERLAREAAVRGAGFLDCPISGTSAMVARGQGIIFVGGERALFDRWRPLLEAVLPRAVHVGRPGQAMTLKLVANLLIALHSAAAAEALSLARRAGLDLDVALDVLSASAAASRMLEVRGPLIIRGDFPPQMKLDLFMKDLHLIQAAAAGVGAPLPLTDVAERLYAAAHAAGRGGEDLAAVVTALDELAGGAHP